MKKMVFVELGLTPFEQAWERQQRCVAAIEASDGPETVHLLEHPHVFTWGRRRGSHHPGESITYLGQTIPNVSVNRGGDVTYHGPGQLVGYPHLDLRRRGRDIHRYLRDLEETVIRTLAGFGIDSFRQAGLTGVWTELGKIASIGVGVRRWVTFHGFALNVAPDLRFFEAIDPCGIAGCPVTSMTSLLARPLAVAEVIPVYRRHCEAVFAGS